MPTTPQIVRAKDFAKTGEYLATVAGKTFRIVCDRGTTWMPGWKVADRHLPKVNAASRDIYEYLGKNKEEALERLEELAGTLRNPIRKRR